MIEMPKTTIGSKLKKLQDAQEREVEQAKKEISEKYHEQRKEIYEACQTNKHRYDNGVSAVQSHRRLSNKTEVSYCKICGQQVAL